MGILSDIINAQPQVTKLREKTTTHIKVDEQQSASKRQRRCVYFAALQFGIRFTGIWDAKVTHSDLEPAIKALHKNAQSTRQEKLDALDYVAELGIAYDAPSTSTAPSEPKHIEPKAQPKPKAKRDTTPLEYARYKRALIKQGLGDTAVEYEVFKQNKAAQPKAMPSQPKAVTPTRQDVTQAAHTEIADLTAQQKLDTLVTGLAALIKAVS